MIPREIDISAFLADPKLGVFTGVPDSLLNPIIWDVLEKADKSRYLPAVNEGAAIGIAIGSYLSSGLVPVVFLQNSGIGNATNPLISLASHEVMSVPMLLVIGWRGEVDENGCQLTDEPQHKAQGKQTRAFLDALDIPHVVISEAEELVSNMSSGLIIAEQTKRPVAVLIKKNVFKNSVVKKSSTYPNITNKHPSREACLSAILEVLKDQYVLVSTTGMLSRELFEYRVKKSQSHDLDLLVVGGMGHSASIAAGIANNCPQQRIFCLDGDGAAQMHLGAIASNAKIKNLTHVIFNNGVHDSVGGHSTAIPELNFTKVCQAFGFNTTVQCNDEKSLGSHIQQSLTSKHSYFIEILCKPGNRDDLGRPNKSPKSNFWNLKEILTR